MRTVPVLNSSLRIRGKNATMPLSSALSEIRPESVFDQTLATLDEFPCTLYYRDVSIRNVGGFSPFHCQVSLVGFI